MSTVKFGVIALIQQSEDGKIKQIAITEAQSIMLQNFLAIISQESKLVIMGEDHELILKSQACSKCKKL